ncbi:deoxyribodipyrimidine photo-lyase [Alteromonas sp.]|uniref:cryptochrome/photolyase family protein n=1 Tax=Alteromonas sp. TaxID=232 RepID=UPI000B633B91|nr:deoxyribodipyrimidine photo-lyase [Alteromonas sp.]MAI36589.1 deoxyribodipyrimidine photolyase [Alteromonas sp.]OUX91046.1 MAG: deoxyribodipyrimidine photolyase [Alteromonas sp. TMED35]
MTVPVSIMWFRQDLRVNDNPALNAACDMGKILPIYIYDDTTPDGRAPGSASQWWLHHSLTSLNDRLNGHLKIFKGDPKVLISKIMESIKAKAIFWNRCYEPWQINRDKEIKKQLIDSEFEAYSSNGSLLWEPMKVLKKDGTPYKVYTPYYRNGCLKIEEPRYPKAPPARITYADDEYKDDGLDALNLLPEIKWDSTISKMWKPGEEGAADNLSEFIQHAARQYKDGRDIPSMKGTSRLSPHLHFGEVSPNQVWYAIKDKFGATEDKSIDTYLSELGWREFSYYLLFHFPTLPNKNFNDKFDKFPWRKDAKALKAWQTGNTGIPIVDAGMRELWQTGYMHNRVRMIVGSFLVKNLLLSWHEGERWFWDTLLDADLASNSAGWQWVAGSGADASPYFRIFNPILQGEKFDKKGKYVRKYCPELKDLPDKYIHKPWETPGVIAKDAKLELGKSYPEPIVDLKASRQRALDAFQEIKG